MVGKNVVFLLFVFARLILLDVIEYLREVVGVSGGGGGVGEKHSQLY